MALLVDQLRWMATHVGDEVAYVDLDRDASITFAQWEGRSNRLARGLTEAGVVKGDRVALHLESEHLHRWIVGYAAIHKAGAVAVPANTRLTARELGAILGHAEPTVAITSQALRPRLDGASLEVPGMATTIVADDEAQWTAVTDHDDSSYQVAVDDDDLADVMYTSGTTGLPKGIAVRHRNTHLIANGQPHWSDQAWIHASPLFTFAGLTFIYNPMKMGMRGLFLARFDADRWFDSVEAQRPTSAFLVPAMVQLLAGHERFAEADLACLTLVSIGSAPLAPILHRRLAERLPAALVTNNYSMTESGSAFTLMPPGELAKRPGSVGLPVPPSEFGIADEHGDPVPARQVGEVLIKVGAHHREYYKDADATARAFSPDGWLRSGDTGYLDEDGYLYIVGRQKDIIIRGGNNIAATEVEHVLYEHPGVLEAAVVGEPHDVLGEVVAAFVVARDGVTPDADGLRAHCAERLADYKVPRSIWFVDQLPRNATGKVLKRDLVPPAVTS
ncbi:MAG: AMP-binding protein [Acidimicrobiales bacterium]